jgi:hypothetical protein
MLHAVSEPDDATPDEGGDDGNTVDTFDGRRLRIDFDIDPLTDLRRMGPAGCRIRPRLTDIAKERRLDRADRSTLLASDMERIDMATIDRGVALFESGGGSTALVMAISFLSASSQRARTNLLLHSNRLQHRAKTSVIWLLSDLPDGAPVGRVSEVVSLLRPFGRAVFAEIAVSAAALRTARSANLPGLMLGPPPTGPSDTDIALWLLHAGRLAEGAAPTLIVEGLANTELLPMAAAAGFTHAVAPPAC